jgi:DNA-binding beta-propeller fold protein YncE
VEAVFARGAADPELLAPSGLAVDGAHAVYVSDAVQGCVKKFAANGCWVATYRSTPRLDGPRGVAVGPGGCLYVADTNNNRVVQLSPDGETGWVLERFAAREGGEGEEELYEPGSVCGGGGLLWVADTNNNRVLAFDAGRRLVRALGGDGLFDFPSAVRPAPGGEALYVADRGNLRVRRFDPQGACTGELVLDPERAGSAGGDVAVDGGGRVLVLDPLREVVFVLAFAGGLT